MQTTKDSNGLVYQKTFLDLFSEYEYSEKEIKELELEHQQMKEEKRNQKFKQFLKIKK